MKIQLFAAAILAFGLISPAMAPAAFAHIKTNKSSNCSTDTNNRSKFFTDCNRKNKNKSVVRRKATRKAFNCSTDTNNRSKFFTDCKKSRK